MRGGARVKGPVVGGAWAAGREWAWPGPAGWDPCKGAPAGSGEVGGRGGEMGGEKTGPAKELGWAGQGTRRGRKGVAAGWAPPRGRLSAGSVGRGGS